MINSKQIGKILQQ